MPFAAQVRAECGQWSSPGNHDSIIHSHVDPAFDAAARSHWMDPDPGADFGSSYIPTKGLSWMDARLSNILPTAFNIIAAATMKTRLPLATPSDYGS